MIFTRKAVDRQKTSGARGALPQAHSEPHNAKIPPSSLQSGAGLNSGQLGKLAASLKDLTATFGQIVAVLMRSTQYKSCALADLEWLVLPALVASQYSLATSVNRASGLVSPVGLILWASVSEAVDRRLSSALDEPIKLQPHEWKSGELIWVIAAVGDARVVQGMLKRIEERHWAKRSAKAYARGEGGKLKIVTIGAKAPVDGSN